MTTVWFDLTDMMHWIGRHLTGVLGVCSGLLEPGQPLRCAAWAGARAGFVEIGPASLPDAVRRSLPGLDTGPAASTTSGTALFRFRLERVRRWVSWQLLGHSEEADQLGRALQQLGVICPGPVCAGRPAGSADARIDPGRLSSSSPRRAVRCG